MAVRGSSSLPESRPHFPAGDRARITAHRGVAGDLVGANPKVVQRMLGHASAAMTLDVYADLFTPTSLQLPTS